MRLLITGGAGYIGSHVVLAALEKEYEVTVFDNLSTGLKSNLNKDAKFVFGSTTSVSDLTKLLKDNHFDAIIHLAASKAAGDSMINPSEYLHNNIIGGLNLIKACLNHDLKIFVYSSTAAVYGMPKYSPIDELHPLKPESYYGYTKLVIEDNLKWVSELKGLRYASLRYFNAAGYDVNKRISGLEINPQNLIPKVMETAIGMRSYINVYGNDYNTADGTGVRDYVHVNDLACAHIDAIEYLIEKENNLSINLGTGIGYSVFDIINKTNQISNNSIEFKVVNRRPGDSSEVIADPLTAKKIINWEARFSDLDTIIH